MRQSLFFLYLISLLLFARPSFAVDVPETAIPRDQAKDQKTIRIPNNSYSFDGIEGIARPLEQIKEPENVAKLPITDIKFVGNTAYSTETLQALLKDKINQPLSVGDINDLALIVSLKYRSEGYFLSYAYIPEQDITSKTLTIAIAEIGLDEVVYDGFTARQQEFFRSIKEEILRSTPISTQAIENYMLRMRNLPGLDVSASMKRDSEGRVILIVSRDTKRSRYGIVSLSNQNSHYMGPWQVQNRMEFNNYIDSLDSLSMVNSLGTDNQELRSIQLDYANHSHFLEHSFRVGAAKSWTEPGYTLRPFRIESVNANVYAEHQYHPFLSREETLNIDTRLSIKENTTKIAGTLFSRDEYSVLSTELSYDSVDGLQGVNALGLGFHQGVPGLSASQNGDSGLTRAGAKNAFNKITASLSRFQKLEDSLKLYAIVDGQYGLTQMYSGEEYSYGGARIGHAYDAGEITGESGVSALAELQYGVLQYEKMSLELFAGYDIGAVWTIDRNTRKASSSGASTFTGARWTIDGRFNVNYEAAKPMTRGVNAFSEDDRKDIRHFVNFSFRY